MPVGPIAGSRSRKLMVALAALPMIGVLAATAGTTDARGVAITCDYDIQSRTLDVAVTPDGGQVQLFRSGDDITVFTNEDPPTQVVCSGNQQATVDNTNLVNVHSDGQDAVLFIDLSGGPFAPGFSNEDDDSPEVEFDVSLPGSQSEIDIYGTSDVDTVSAGSLGSDKGMNLNAAEVKKALKITTIAVAWRQYFSIQPAVTIRNLARKKKSTGNSNMIPVTSTVPRKRSR